MRAIPQQKLVAAALLLWLAVSPAMLTGCQLFGKKPAANTTDDSGDDNTSNKPAAPPTNATDDLSPHPLIENYRPISVKMADGLKIVGTLYIPNISPYKPPSAKPVSSDDSDSSGGDSASGDDSDQPKKPPAPPPVTTHYPLIILLHMLSDDRWVWGDVPKQLVGAGYAVLALDMRGHGDSVYMGKTLMVWRQFDASDWPKMVDDIPAVVDYIHKQPDFAMVNTDNVGIVGASIGANVAINAAHQRQDSFKALVLMSPGLDYHGIQTFDPVTDLSKTAMFYLASKEDDYGTMSAEKLYKFTQGKKKIQIYQDVGHGTDMLTTDPEISKTIVQWLVGILPPPGQKSAEAKADDKSKAADDKTKTDKDKKDETATPAVKPAEKKSEKKPEKAEAKKDEKPASTVKKDSAKTPASKPAASKASTPSTKTTTTPSTTSDTTTPQTSPTTPSTTTTTTPVVKPVKVKKAVKSAKKPAVAAPVPVDKPSDHFDAPITNINTAPPPPPPVSAPIPTHSGPYRN